MKKLFSFIAIIGIILASNCSRIPENNDPVIGVWSDVSFKTSSQASRSTIKKEWIFNDAYLGRFHQYNNNQVEILTDFRWSEDNGVYTISYPGIADKVDDIVTMVESEGGTLLRDSDGTVMAIRE